ncbi:hypothetical protein OUZ56_021404 [Daphnia magna]|uniref:Uncharacterized protein n=1 Tax=Daphnia magna TaxID=35525 RepID=A0ABQ9ZHC4_9CRUS|nr:hypothetical protein OUZ56_021404 [Daphnia magna]
MNFSWKLLFTRVEQPRTTTIICGPLCKQLRPISEALLPIDLLFLSTSAKENLLCLQTLCVLK